MSKGLFLRRLGVTALLDVCHKCIIEQKSLVTESSIKPLLFNTSRLLECTAEENQATNNC
jgi:hypothetical protein